MDWQVGQSNEPHFFWDSDVAKVLEGMAYMLKLDPQDHALAEELETYVDLFCQAQQPDGYLNSYFCTECHRQERWQNVYDHHELYCAGHLIEAAVAHFQATNSKKFLDCVCRYADYIAKVFGTAPGQIPGYPGHEEIELALCKLATATGQKKYLDLAKYFIDQRGVEPNFFANENGQFHPERNRGELQNRQAHLPVRQQHTADGHAVRAVYLYTGMAAVAERTNDRELLDAVETIYANLSSKRLYVIGGIGSTSGGESFTGDYNLPNDTNYAESCANMGLAQLSCDLLNFTGKSQYAEVMELALYNAAISGLSLSGDRFFYVNPMEVTDLEHPAHRVPWFDCSCCPTSYCRFLPQLGTFAWSYRQDTLVMHLPVAAQVDLPVGKINVQSGYPYDGEIHLQIQSGGHFKLKLRVPAWCAKYTLSVNKTAMELPLLGQYVTIEKDWQIGDEVILTLAMPVTLLAANPRTTANRGKAVLKRGPLVYAVEAADNGDKLLQMHLDLPTDFQLVKLPGLLPGTLGIVGKAKFADAPNDNTLYYVESAANSAGNFTAVPYSLWGNRGDGAMLVWLPKA